MSTPIDWEQFRVKEEDAQSGQNPLIRSAASPTAESVDWSQFIVGGEEPKKEQSYAPESWPQYTGRQLARSGQRAVETVLGLPGDLTNLLFRTIGGAAENLSGQKLPALQAILGGEFPKEMQAKFEKAGYKPSFIGLPTSEDVKTTLSKLTGESISEPRTPGEKEGDEFFETYSSLLTPGGAVKAGTQAIRALGASLFGQAAKQTVKQFGGTEGQQEGAKLASIFVTSLIDPKGAANYTKGLYSEANAALPKGAKVSARGLERSLKSLESSLEKGVSTADKEAVLKPIRELLRKARSGSIGVDELVSARRDINAIAKDYTTQRGAKKLLGVINKNVDDALREYGKKNPKFAKEFFAATKAYETVESSKFIRKAIGRMARKYPFQSALLLGLEHSLFGAKALPFLAAGAAASGVGQTLYRYMKSPALRKYYQQLMAEAAKSNVQGVEKSLQRLDKAAKREDEMRKNPILKPL